jgi:RNA 2',3'-cyclic 3'-phosphodiesterase
LAVTKAGREPRVRLFVALELPSEVRASLARWRDPTVTSSLRALTDDALHVTLCFLGSQDAGQVPSVLSACLAAVRETPAAPLRLGDGLWLPRRGPRVLAVELVDLSGVLGAAQARLSDALAAGGWYRPEPRPYLAHVTVARVRHGSRVRASELSPPEPLEFTGSRVTLFRSRLSPSGARYEPLGSVELGS